MKILSKVKNYIKTALKNIIKGRKVVSSINVPVLESMLLKNRCIAISGGSGGIGSAIAKACVNNGAKVIIMGTNEAKMKELCDNIGENCKYVKVDLYNFSSYREIVEKCSSVFPSKRIDTLINAAGTMSSMEFLNVSENEWDNVMDLNMKSPYFLAQHFAKYFIKNGISAHILNVSSTSGLKPGWTPYGISKAGVNSMTLGMADDLIEHSIVVNSIAPGPVATQMLGVDDGNLHNERYKAKRFASPEEIGNWAVMMISGMSDLMIGETVYISAGSGTLDICKSHK